MKNFHILIILIIILFFILRKKEFFNGNYKQDNIVDFNTNNIIRHDLPYHLRYNLKYTKNNVHVYAKDVLGYSPCPNVKYPGDYLN